MQMVGWREKREVTKEIGGGKYEKERWERVKKRYECSCKKVGSWVGTHLRWGRKIDIEREGGNEGR